MNTLEITSLILGVIGTLTGVFATWLSLKAIRQELILSRTDPCRLSFRITNLSLRPIPVQSITLELKEGSRYISSSEPPQIKGIELPGVLPPESCFSVQWAGTRQIVEMVFHEEFILSVTTQTGRTFRLKGIAKKRNR